MSVRVGEYKIQVKRTNREMDDSVIQEAYISYKK